MLGSVTFDLVLGMAFIFLLLSLVCSAVREAVEARLKTRARYLARGVVQLLGGPGAAQAFYEHPMVKALYDGPMDPAALEFKGLRSFKWIWAVFMSLFRRATPMPSYVPARTFALTVVDLVRQRRLLPGEAPAAQADMTALAELRAILQARSAEPLAQALLAALAPVGDDLERALQALQQWYDGAMDRVSGWYKRESQHILFWVGVVVAVALNVDSIFLVKYLAADQDARAYLVDAVQQVTQGNPLADLPETLSRAPAEEPAASAAAGAARASDTKSIDDADLEVAAKIRALTDLNLPIGWNAMRWHEFSRWNAQTLWTALGWLVTAFGLSFGAPFWFDALNKLMVIRSTVKPHEKSPEESSEDRQRK